MQYRRLGKTGIAISVLSFGAGPVSTLMVGDDHKRQQDVIDHAIKQGINCFDTAATYGSGQSESSLGRSVAAVEQSSGIRKSVPRSLVSDSPKKSTMRSRRWN
jgi:aryl-alcohol dehydrogenase-like predicted oxidoreductase